MNLENEGNASRLRRKKERKELKVLIPRQKVAILSSKDFVMKRSVKSVL